LQPETRAREVTEDLEHELVFVGLAGMYDPPRPEAKDAVTHCRDASIRVVMITGDHPHTALAVARELGIAGAEDAALTGSELSLLSDHDLRQRVAETAVYARVSAGHKLRIIRAWKAKGAVVAMTGDGVNDAPALKGADIGIAMGIKGTEVTRAASDMVITDDNFATVVAAVEQGRGIYENIRKTLQYLLAGNTAELLLMTGSILAGLPAPLLPVHLLWINLVTDGFPALCLATDSIDRGVMRRPPRPRTERVTDRAFLTRLILAGGLTALVCFGVFLWALNTGSVESARSMTFTAVVFCELFKSFSFRSETHPIWRMPVLSNLQLPLVVAASFALQLLMHHVEFLSRLLKTVTPDWNERWLLLAIGFVPLLVLEVTKHLRGPRGQSL
jgi:Ca2+-transporting ATPase